MYKNHNFPNFSSIKHIIIMINVFHSVDSRRLILEYATKRVRFDRQNASLSNIVLIFASYPYSTIVVNVVL